jgi:DNA-binding response OmpR family regulator
MALILVIEDDPDAAQIAADCLDLLGYEVEIVPDGIDAICWLRDHKPDAVLLDICLPDIDGLTLYNLIRMVEHGRGVPIIPVSAIIAPGAQVVKDLRVLGATAFLPKPFALVQLEAALREVISCATS